VDSTLKYVGEDEEVNTPQKNPNVASLIGRILCKVGSSELVIDAGSGATSWAGSCGVRVAALEKDPRNFQELTLRLTAEASYPAKALKQAAEEEEYTPRIYINARLSSSGSSTKTRSCLLVGLDSLVQLLKQQLGQGSVRLDAGDRVA
jgi:hypothetical protein